MGFMDELKKIFAGDEKSEGKNKNFLRNLVILGMLGILILLFSDLFINTDVKKRGTESNYIEVLEVDFEKKISRELEEIIGLMKGVGKVKANVYVKKYTVYEYEYNSSKINKKTNETDQNGGEREIVEDNVKNELVIIKDVSGNEKPVLKKETGPEIEGVLIVAQGAENSYIKYQILKAVSSLLDISIHRISVLPYERG